MLNERAQTSGAEVGLYIYASFFIDCREKGEDPARKRSLRTVTRTFTDGETAAVFPGDDRERAFLVRKQAHTAGRIAFAAGTAGVLRGLHTAATALSEFTKRR